MGSEAREDRRMPSLEEAVVKYHSRPSTQYRYEHYDPTPRA